MAWTRSWMGSVAVLAACGPGTLTLSPEGAADDWVAVVLLDRSRAIVDVSSARIGDLPLRSTTSEAIAHYAVLTVPQPVDELGVPLDDVRIGLGRGCACSIPAASGPTVLAAGDACLIPHGSPATLYDRSGEPETGTDAAETLAEVAQALVLSRDDRCRPVGLEHHLAVRVDECDLTPAPAASRFAIDGLGHLLAISRTGQAALWADGGRRERWPSAPYAVVHGQTAGGFMLANADGGSVTARSVTVRDGSGRTESVVTVEGAWRHLDGSTEDPTTGATWLVGRDPNDAPLLASCGGDRCTLAPVPCGLSGTLGVANDATGRLIALLSETRVAWRVAADWVCSAPPLTDERRVGGLLRVGPDALLFAAQSNGGSAALYRTPLPPATNSTWTLVGEYGTVRDPAFYPLDDGGYWLMTDDATLTVSPLGQAARVATDTLGELGRLIPEAVRSSGAWTAVRFANGQVAWRSRGEALRSAEPLVPGGGPLVALDDGRALAIDPGGTMLLDATGGCDSATVTRAADHVWPDVTVAARSPGDARVLLGGDTPSPWIRWADVDTGAFLGERVAVPGARAWRTAVAFLPGHAALLDVIGEVFVASPSGVVHLQPETDDPSTEGPDTNDALDYNVLVGCSGAAWVAGDGAEALARIATDGHGGFRLEAFWGRRAQLARSGETRADRFQHLAVACIDAHDILLTADVKVSLVDTVATARYTFSRDSVLRAAADTAGRIPDNVALGWAGAPTHLYYLQSGGATLLGDSLPFRAPVAGFAETWGATYLTFGGPLRRYSWLLPH